jgi:hypothetical protein
VYKNTNVVPWGLLSLLKYGDNEMLISESLGFEVQQNLWKELWDKRKMSINGWKNIFELGFIVDL